MTMQNFSLLEAVEVAINMEEEGIRFYGLAAKRLPDPAMKKLFEILLEKEHEHVALFRRVFQDLSAKEPDPDATLWLLDDETSAYFRASVESAVFPVKGAADKVLAGLDKPRDILRLGLRVEKDSMHFYRELMGHAPWPGAKELLERVIAEERRHFFFIFDRLKALPA